MSHFNRAFIGIDNHYTLVAKPESPRVEPDNSLTIVIASDVDIKDALRGVFVWENWVGRDLIIDPERDYGHYMLCYKFKIDGEKALIVESKYDIFPFSYRLCSRSGTWESMIPENGEFPTIELGALTNWWGKHSRRKITAEDLNRHYYEKNRGTSQRNRIRPSDDRQ